MADQQEAQKNMVVRWFEEVWNQGKREVIDEMFPTDCVLHDGRAEYRGPEEFKRFYDGLRAQLSDIQVTPLQAISEGDLVCVRWSARAKQTTTGKPLEVTGMSFLRFKDGRFFEAWQNWDMHGLVEQLEGKVPGSFFQAAG
jgi:predicted SnoaL-like aldol condensation-catalyzing enzyme